MFQKATHKLSKQLIQVASRDQHCTNQKKTKVEVSKKWEDGDN